MYILGNLFIGLAEVLHSVCFLAMLVVIASVVVSWVNADPYNTLVRIIQSLIQPMYRFVRKYVPTVFGALDLTPLILLLIIMFVQSGVLPSLSEFGYSLK